jgi:GMP synthase (glutamine-hydrolysing)
MQKHQQILILDFGSQYTQLIARRLRELGVYCEILSCTHAPQKAEGCIGLILSGGPSSVYDKDAPPFDAGWLELGLPTLGICYGMQLMASLSGGKVQAAEAREYGAARVQVVRPDALVEGFKKQFQVWMSHGDQVAGLPAGFYSLLSTETCPTAAFVNPDRKLWGLQFHPEVVHTENGTRILQNFAFSICGATGDWNTGGYVGERCSWIQEQVGPEEEVICALSGGVDSAVTAVLAERALHGRLRCVFVDNGLLRAGEREQVAEDFKQFNLTVVDARERFLTALSGVTDPERKRKIIGEEFIRVFEEEAKKYPEVKWLAQGTLYPDVIESVSFKGGPSATIKSHHNVGGLPERMALKLLEPLRELFKDEVRSLGRSLEMPERRLMRQPFPGPGLAVRCLGTITAARLAVLQKADAIVQEELEKLPEYPRLWQSFAVLLPVRSVGVMGDSRTYEETCILRAVESLDGMTATVAELPISALTRISTRIINEVRGINRVAYDISTKPPATIEWE